MVRQFLVIGEPSTAMSEFLRRKLVSPMPVIPAVTEITTATITGVMGTTLAGVNATTPTGGHSARYWQGGY